MIVCPSCKFENPSHHRYCQECGELLPVSDEPGHEKSGVDSSSVVDSSEVDDPLAAEGSFIPAMDPSSPSAVDSVGDYGPDAIRLAILSVVPSHWQAEDGTPLFLDTGERYRVLSRLNTNVLPQEHDTGLEFTVLDTQPFVSVTPDHLGDGELLAGESLGSGPLVGERLDEVLMDEGRSQHTAAATETDDLARDDDPDNAPDSGPIGSVLIHQIYQELEAYLYPSFPKLVDTWHDQGPILILENRDALVSLTQVVSQPDVVTPQILHWLHELTELWELLSQRNCCMSVLATDNIRVDEDQILCLRRLYADPVDSLYTLKDFGAIWESLDQASVLPWPDGLVQVYRDLLDGRLADVEALRVALEQAADQVYQSTLVESAPPVPEGKDDVFDPSALDAFASKIMNQQINTDDVAPSPEIAGSPKTDSGLSTADSRASGSRMAFGSLSACSDDPTVVLPMQLHTLTHVGTTNIGIQRDHNEDFFTIDTQINISETPSGRICQARGLYVLCDGMGGHAAGEVASALAGETIQNYFAQYWAETLPDEKTIADGIVLANQAIYDQNQESASEGSRRMGTTLVTLLIQDTKAAIAHVGDSRIYRFTRRQGLEQLTVDHEVGQREISRGVDPEVAYARPDAYQLTQALGPRDQDFIRPEIQFIEMNEDSLFILGSDGLTDNQLLETYCESHIEPLMGTNANLDEGAGNLIDLANQINGHDNITVLIVRVKLRPKLSLLNR